MTHPSIRRVLLLTLSATFAIGTLSAVPSPANAEVDGGAAPGVARISAIQGDVALRHTADGEEIAAETNAPIEAGDYLSSGADGFAEIQLDSSDLIRVNSGAQLRFTQMDGQHDVAQLADGTIELRTFDGYRDQLTIQTPSVDITPGGAGAALITVESNGNTKVTVRSGSVTVTTPQGSQDVQPGRTMEITGNANNPQYQWLDTAAATSFDNWNDDRDREFLQVASLAPYEYVNNNVVGADDLAKDGQWTDTPQYGEVWQPDDVAPNWTPYSDGSWAYEPYYGYTWVANEPWGWAPYHYGRWVYAPVGWAWVPGPREVAPVWSPALVAFFGFGGGGEMSLGFGNIGWVPLAPGEPLHRWWGGGNTIVYNTTIVVNHYQNYNRGIVALPITRWQNGDFGHAVHWTPQNVHGVHAIAGRIPLTPTRENYRFAPRETRITVTQTNYQRFSSRPWQRFGTSTMRAAPERSSAWQRINPTYSRQQAPSYVRQQPAYRSIQPQPVYQRAQPVQRVPIVRSAPPSHEGSRPHRPGGPM